MSNKEDNKLAQQCIFCGKKPENKNKEHVIPYGPFIVLALLIINFTKLNIKEIFEKVLNIIS